MLIQYDGAHPEVVVDELSQDIVIKAGVPTEIPDDLAARLLEQSTWSKASKPSAPASTGSPVTIGPALPDTTNTGSN